MQGEENAKIRLGSQKLHYMIKIIANVVGAGLVSARNFEGITKICIIYKKRNPFPKKEEKKNLSFWIKVNRYSCAILPSTLLYRNKTCKLKCEYPIL